MCPCGWMALRPSRYALSHGEYDFCVPCFRFSNDIIQFLKIILIAVEFNPIPVRGNTKISDVEFIKKSGVGLLPIKPKFFGLLHAECHAKFALKRRFKIVQEQRADEEKVRQKKHQKKKRNNQRVSVCLYKMSVKKITQHRTKAERALLR